MGIFSKNPEVAPTVPALRKRSKALTCAELWAAIEAACAGLASDWSGVKTLEQLRLAATLGRVDSEIVSTFNDRYPVSLAELDAALAGLPHASPATLSTLKRARALLAGENPVKRSEPVQHVTVDQLKAHDAALFDAVGWAIGGFAEEFNRSHPSRAHVLDMLSRTANTPERKTVLRGIALFEEAKVPRRTQEEWLRYQNTGSWS